MPRNCNLQCRNRALLFGFVLLLPAVSGFCHDSYKCQGEQRVVRRDRGCLPGERVLEITPGLDLRIKRNPPLSIAPAEKSASTTLPAREAAAAGAPATAYATHSAGTTAAMGASNTGRMKGVIGGTGVVADTITGSSADPVWAVPSWSDPPQKWLDIAGQLAAYGRTCATEQFNTPACGIFRDWTVVAAIALVMLVLLQILRRLAREQKAINEHKKWLAAQGVVADAETMKQHTWEGDAAVDVDMSQEDLAAAIRNAVVPHQRA
jgi:hypothetical protein